jgi:hypothetical protein
MYIILENHHDEIYVQYSNKVVHLKHRLISKFKK